MGLTKGRINVWLAPCALLATSVGCTAHAQVMENPIGHIIVISLENHSFDNLFGAFPGAEGIAQAGSAAVQVDARGQAFRKLPPVIDTTSQPLRPDTRFPSDLPNAPFPIERYVAAKDKTGDLVHRFYQEQAQINGGAMNRFAGLSDAGGLAMGYYDASGTALWRYAREYTLADRFFHAAFGGSFLNHFWMVCACTPRFDAAPPQTRAELDDNGLLRHDGPVTPDGYAVNTLQPEGGPHMKGIAPDRLLPPQTMPTIGERLSAASVSWAWYAGGWAAAEAGHAAKDFQYHHQPFAYFSAYAPGSEARAEHLKDEADFFRDLKEGTLPAVSFYKPSGDSNWHPGYADVTTGDAHFAKIMKAIEESPVWKSSVVIVTFDENGGYWDHVPPPKGDRWGPGVRVPTLIISPFARRHFVDHTAYDTTSILRFIEARFGLEPLGERDRAAGDLGAGLDFETPVP